mmetsp:Transcript_29189/g.70435  ORF Transcript_29189/g.70435 Transcript_29189/m.70435 type:complete len:281 (+) Transcript_29189:89-931(+)|eukprot:CAMPEP_0113626030 /NCGR_PEP_ID=MMETSP0017_2-20120614/13456_1 /TAXON_ID=2856 /ORGANISM="Cylindrotheca closterium" /LENGTH=280 /DNA_ID=CAMNT_0000536185 /DNA_START=88 /DNA_END=930 /DNA_ORIENTATION=+ /assembly_acc=CAM_ASM_000147
MEKSLVQQHGCSWKEASDALMRVKVEMGYSRSIKLTSLREDVQQTIRSSASALIASQQAEEAQERHAMEQSIRAVQEQLRQDEEQIQDNALTLMPDSENLSQDLRFLPPMLREHDVDHAKWTLIYNLVLDMKVVVKQARFLERQMLTRLQSWKNDSRNFPKIEIRAIEHLVCYNQIVSNCNLVANNALTVANMILAPHGLYAQLAIEKTRWMYHHKLPHLRIASMRPIGLQFHQYGVAGVAPPTSFVQTPATAEIQMADVIAVTAADGSAVVVEDNQNDS